MTNSNLYCVLRKNFPTDLDKIAFTVPEYRNVSYRTLEHTVEKFALTLITNGVNPGDRVMVQTHKSPEVIALYLACLQIGAIYIPLNTAYENGELKYFLSDAEPSIFVTSTEREKNLRKTIASNVVILTLDADGQGSLFNSKQETCTTNIYPANPNEIAAIIYTSGTTGRPKGAMLSHKNLSSNSITLAKLWAFTKTDVLLHALPIYHVHGLFVATHCALLRGAEMIFLPSFDAEIIIKNINTCTVMMGVPTFYHRMLANPQFKKGDYSNVRLFISGSAPLGEKTWLTFFNETGHKILERYGMSETGMIASNPYYGERIPSTVGFPIPEVTVRAVNENGFVCETGQIGELEVKGPNVFSGYWNLKENNSSDFTEDGFFKTGDLVIQTNDSRIKIVGRKKDLIITGGLNVYPKEVESLIDTLAGVKESAVVGFADDDFGEVVVAFVCREKESTVNENDVFSQLKTRIANYKRPKKIYFVDALPRNAMGKVQKNILRERGGKEIIA